NARGNERNLQNAIYEDITATFPAVHARVRVLLLNITLKKIKTAKAATGNLKGWMAILLNKQGRPNSNHVIPIPFDTANSKIIPGKNDKDNASLFVRLHRDDSKARAISAFDEF